MTSHVPGRATLVDRPWIWPLYSLVAVVVGLNLLISPARYDLVSYRDHFRIANQAVWGWAFLAVGILALGARFSPPWPKGRRAEMLLAQIVVASQAALFAGWALAFLPRFATGLGPINATAIWTASAFANTRSLWISGTGRPPIG